MEPLHHRAVPRRSLLALLFLGAAGLAMPARAEPAALASKRELPKGRPDVILDRLDLPDDLERAAQIRKQLREILKREVRRVTWGAGTGNRITYRFTVTRLTIEQQGDVVKVVCSATGRLPKGKVAKSHLSFGGPANKRSEVVRRVLEIVARGVVARLAELERERRGYN
ncbi:MAG: hypothetical protein KF915_17150 [Polyangiaceae bacterium]|nr:hypothetical protein [Polyangiaceae bacterium]